MPIYILQNEFASTVRQDLATLYGNLISIDSSGEVIVADATLPYGDVLHFFTRAGTYVGIRGEASSFTLNPNVPIHLRDRGGVTLRTSAALPTNSVEIIYDALDADGQGYFVYDAHSSRIAQFRHITLLHELAHAMFQTVGGMFTEDQVVENIENSFRTANNLTARNGHGGGIPRPAATMTPSSTPPAGGSCFTASTPVLTTLGYRPIGAIKVGSAVLSYDIRSGCLRERIVSKRIVYASGRVWKILMESSDVIETTAYHSFLTKRGWMRAKKLKTGDEILTVPERGKPASQKVVKIVDTGHHEAVYNLRTTGEHNFLAHGCVAHNFGYFRALRTWWHRLLVDPFIKHWATGGAISDPSSRALPSPFEVFRESRQQTRASLNFCRRWC